MVQFAAKLVPLTFVELPDELRTSSDLVMSWHDRFEEDPANRWLRQAAAKLTTLFDGEYCSLC